MDFKAKCCSENNDGLLSLAVPLFQLPATLMLEQLSLPHHHIDFEVRGSAQAGIPYEVPETAGLLASSAGLSEAINEGLNLLNRIL